MFRKVLQGTTIAVVSAIPIAIAIALAIASAISIAIPATAVATTLIWGFPKIRGTVFWGPYNMDPTI